MILPLLLSLAAVCIEPSGTRVTAGELAAVSPALKKLPPDLVLGYAPRAGFTRVFTAAELRQWLSRHRLGGDGGEDVCVAWQLGPLDAEWVRSAMLRQLPPGSEVEVLETSRFGVPKGEAEFPRSGLQGQIWKGYVKYGKELHHDIWARVDVRIPWQRVVATQDLKPGEPVAAGGVRMETGFGPPTAKVYASAVEEAVGRVPRQTIPAGTALLRSALGKGTTVQKGDTVHVSVRAGGAQLRFEGTAQGSGAEGETVAVRMADTGHVVRPRITARGQALLDLNGGMAR